MFSKFEGSPVAAFEASPTDEDSEESQDVVGDLWKSFRTGGASHANFMSTPAIQMSANHSNGVMLRTTSTVDLKALQKLRGPPIRRFSRRDSVSLLSLDTRANDEADLQVETDEALSELISERKLELESLQGDSERKRLQENEEYPNVWHAWGPYLSERQWGTVREDYSESGDAWRWLTHEQARSKAYRWGEDGIAGWSDRRSLFCFSLALWNHKDGFLKERLFGLPNGDGNHGEDVKEYYYYSAALPSHAYNKMIYRYPHNRYPYEKIVEENKKRGLQDMEYELVDTGIFHQNRFFDVATEFVKVSVDDFFINIAVTNQGPDRASIVVLPQFWFRNTWVWDGKPEERPEMKMVNGDCITAPIPMYGDRYVYYESGDEFLFTENETNNQKLYNAKNQSPYVKDAFHEYVCSNNKGAVNPACVGSKATRVHRLELDPRETKYVRVRVCPTKLEKPAQFGTFPELLELRINECDAFYETITPDLPDEQKIIQRQAFAGMLWSKQFYYFNIYRWIHGDPAMPKPPASKERGRNVGWEHMHCKEIISMPDKWEYPWFAAWDLAFHCVPLAMVDPLFAKEQLLLLTREWYMHPNGALPAYEWNFNDVNPPVHAWAVHRTFKIEQKMNGKTDHLFLARVFHKLLLNFTWWVNRKDGSNQNVFEGGFLGLDNIGVFDRSNLPEGVSMEQSDATAWMAMYCLVMLQLALELALHDKAYEDTASKFFEHFMYISKALNQAEKRMWDDADGFYYDALRSTTDNKSTTIKVRSLVGLMPMLAVAVLEPDVLQRFPDFTRRLHWFVRNRPDICKNIDFTYNESGNERILLTLVPRARLVCLLRRMLDPNEFLSDYGIRSLSKHYQKHPYKMTHNGEKYGISYEPGESRSYMFGGNSNWRGPIWYPINFLLIECLQKYDFYYGESLMVECPTHSGNQMNLWQVSLELEKRMRNMFMINKEGRRPCFGGNDTWKDPLWRDNILFYEYFHGDNGAGIGASHQTGWTGLICKIMDQLHTAEENNIIAAIVAAEQQLVPP